MPERPIGILNMTTEHFLTTENVSETSRRKHPTELEHAEESPEFPGVGVGAGVGGGGAGVRAGECVHPSRSEENQPRLHFWSC